MGFCIGNVLVSVNLGFYIRSVQIIAPRPASCQQSSSSILNQMQLNDQGLIPSLNRILSAAVAAELGPGPGSWWELSASDGTRNGTFGNGFPFNYHVALWYWRQKKVLNPRFGPLSLGNIILTFCQVILSLISPWPGHPTWCCSVNTNYSRVAEAMFAERSGRGGNMSSGHCLY